MRPDDVAVERLLAGKAKAVDAAQADRDGAIIVLHDGGATAASIVHTLGLNTGTVQAVLSRELARRARRAAWNARVSA